MHWEKRKSKDKTPSVLGCRGKAALVIYPEAQHKSSCPFLCFSFLNPTRSPTGTHCPRLPEQCSPTLGHVQRPKNECHGNEQVSTCTYLTPQPYGGQTLPWTRPTFKPPSAPASSDACVSLPWSMQPFSSRLITDFHWQLVSVTHLENLCSHQVAWDAPCQSPKIRAKWEPQRPQP